MLDEDDPDNYPYDNVEFPVRKPVVTRYTPSPRLVVTPDKSTLLEPLLESLEIEAIEADGTAPAKTTNLVIGPTNTSSDKTSSHTSTILFSKNATSYGSSGCAQNAMNSTRVSTQPHAQSPTLRTHPQPSVKTEPNQSPINRLKSSMVESKQQTTLENKTDNTQTILRQPQAVTWPFGRNDFNTHSQKVLDDAYLTQESHDELHSTLIKQGHALQKPLQTAREKLRERLTYEQLLQGMLFDGERLLLNGHWVYFNRVEFRAVSGEKDIRPPLGNGRACLTNKRLLLLVAESCTDADLEMQGKESYEMCMSQREDVIYITVPMHCFRSIEMGVSVGSTARVKVKRAKPKCGCLGRPKWRSSAPLVTSHNTRTIQMGIVMPPWNTHTLAIIHTHPDLPLTLTRDFVSYVQSYAQQLH